MIIIGSDTGKIYIFDIQTRSCEYSLDNQTLKKEYPLFDEDKIISALTHYIDPTDGILRIVSGTDSGKIFIWNTKSKKCDQVLIDTPIGKHTRIYSLIGYVGSDKAPRIIEGSDEVRIWKLTGTAFETAFGVKNDRNPQDCRMEELCAEEEQFLATTKNKKSNNWYSYISRAAIAAGITGFAAWWLWKK